MRKSKSSLHVNHFVQIKLDGLKKYFTAQFQNFLKEQLHVDSFESVEILSTPDAVVFRPDSEV